MATASASKDAYPGVLRRTSNVKKVMIVKSRGVTTTFIDMIADLVKLMPHVRKDSKFDKKEPLSSLVEIAELAGCAYCLYFEARKMKDLYLWAGAVAGGPCVKFLVQQVRPMDDLRLTGNCLMGSRPILSFGAEFGAAPHLRLIRQLLGTIFGPPKGHPKSKPFHDHVLSFSLLGGRVLVRHYQVVPPRNTKDDDVSLVEIGPRLALVPIRVLEGAFSGQTLYANGSYVSPNVRRAENKRPSMRRAMSHVAQKEARRKRINDEGRDLEPEDEVGDTFDGSDAESGED